MNKRVLHRVRSKEYLAMGKMGAIVLLGLFLTFIGCGGEAPKPTKVPIPPVGQKSAVPAPAKEPPGPTAEVKTTEPPPAAFYNYNPQGKSNPFQPLVVEKTETPVSPQKKLEQAARGEEKEPGTPLERMELGSLRLVAVVWNIANPRAMVEDSGGKGYILTVGTRIGKNRGQVTKITPSGVVVSEKYETDGKIKTREVPLRLYAAD